MKKISLTLLTLFVFVTAISAQSRYKHVPRVQVDANRVEKTNIKMKKVETVSFHSVTNEVVVEENNASVSKDEEVLAVNEVASASDEELVLVKKQPRSQILHKKSMKANKKVDLNFFTNKIKENSKLLKVQDAAKTNGALPIILLIVFYVLAVVFTVLCILFLLGSGYNFTLFLVFLILALVFALAASVLLTLIKIGVL